MGSVNVEEGWKPMPTSGPGFAPTCPLCREKGQEPPGLWALPCLMVQAESQAADSQES